MKYNVNQNLISSKRKDLHSWWSLYLNWHQSSHVLDLYNLVQNQQHPHLVINQNLFKLQTRLIHFHLQSSTDQQNPIKLSTVQGNTRLANHVHCWSSSYQQFNFVVSILSITIISRNVRSTIPSIGMSDRLCYHPFEEIRLNFCRSECQIDHIKLPKINLKKCWRESKIN